MLANLQECERQTSPLLTVAHGLLGLLETKGFQLACSGPVAGASKTQPTSNVEADIDPGHARECHLTR